MNSNLYTVNQISQMLGIHPKTVQRYIREGKLRAAKIGKSWRVSGHDLSLFAESNSNISDENPEFPIYQTRAKASSVIDIEMFSEKEATRLTNALTAAMNAKPYEYSHASLHTQFIGNDSLLRISLWGNVEFMTAVFNIIDAYLNRNGE